MTAAKSASRGPRPDDPHATLRLAPGVELLGESPDLGFSHPRYLLRRPDGQVVLVSGLLYLVADALAEHDRPADVARIVTNQVGRAVTAADVERLAIAKLQPIGVIASGNDNPAIDDALPRINPLLTLGLRAGVVPVRLHRTLTTTLRPLFRPSVVVAILIALALVDAWLAAHSSVLVDASVQVAANPSLVVAGTALVLASLAFHEIGHVTACCYGAGRQATTDVAVYGVWPTLSTHVIGAYGLDRRGRLRTDLGGVYFNAVFALAAAALYAVSSLEPLLGVAVLAQMQALYQLLPFVRLDGYHILGDLAGVPNLFAYVRPAALTLLPARRGTRAGAERALGGLRPRSRVAVRAWVAMTVPLLLINLTLAAYLALRTVPVLWQSVQAAGVELAAAAEDGRWLTVMGITAQLTLLAFPLMGCAVLLARAGQLLSWRVAAMARNSRDRMQPLVRSSSVLLPLTMVLCIALLCAVVGLTIGGQRDADTRRAGAPAQQGSPPTTAPTASTAPAPSTGDDVAPTSTPPTASPPATRASLTVVEPVGPTPQTAAAGPTLTLTPPATPAMPAMPATPATWTVQPGDDLWSVAQIVTGQVLGRPASDAETAPYWSQLLDANGALLPDPDLIFAGQVLLLPDGAGSPATPS